MSSPLVRRGGLLSPSRLVLTFVVIFLYYISRGFRGPADPEYGLLSSLESPFPTPVEAWEEYGEGSAEDDTWDEPESAQKDWYDKVPSYLKTNKASGKGRLPVAASRTATGEATTSTSKPKSKKPWLEDEDEREKEEKTDKEDKSKDTWDDAQDTDADGDLPIWAHSTTKSSTFHCEESKLADSILLILKTGATELYAKLPMHLGTTLRCVPHYLIFSDLEQDIQSLHVEDALGDVTPKWKDEHRDFELYRKQKELQKEGMDIGSLKGGKGWDLDKWKFLPMIKKTWEKRPLGIRWFVFVEADTYLSWHNLLLWLRQLDADNRYYMGSQVMIGDTTFAHGGSGFIISHGAMRRLYEEVRDKQTWWEEKMPQNCCGDKVLAEALLARDVKLMHSFPLTQGERVWSVDWSETHWCKAAVTWHHVKPNEVDAHWRFETEWGRTKDDPILYRDYYAHFVEPNLRDSREGWDNLSGDWKVTSTDHLDEKSKDAYTSFDACKSACVDREECLQFKWEPGQCLMAKFPRLGKPLEEGDESKDMKSGWLLDRIEKYVEKRDKCKASDAWILR